MGSTDTMMGGFWVEVEKLLWPLAREWKATDLELAQALNLVAKNLERKAAAARASAGDLEAAKKQVHRAHVAEE